MALSLGSALATKVYLGATEVSLAYLGATQVYTSSAFSAEAQDYFDRLDTAGDTTYTAYKQPLANYIDSLVALGGAYWDDLESAASFVGVGIQGVTVPLKSTMTALTNNNFVAGDLNQLTGLKGDALTKYIETSVLGTDLAQDDASVSVYVTETGANDAYYGNGVVSGSISSFVSGYIRMNSAGLNGGVIAQSNALYGVSRDNSANFDHYNGSSNTIVDASTGTTSGEFVIFAEGASPTRELNCRLATYHIGPALDLATLEGLQETLLSEVAAVEAAAAAENYFARLVTAGDTTHTAYKTPITNYFTGLFQNNLWDKLESSALFVGVGIQGVTVPLKSTMPTLTNNNFVAGDLNTLTGLKGDASTKYLDTGALDNSTSQNDVSLSVWVTDNVPLDNAYWIGSQRLAQRSAINNTAVKFSARTTSSSQVNPSPDIVDGFIGQTRTVSTDFDWFINTNSGNFVKASTTPPGTGIGVFSYGAGFNKNASRIATYHYGTALNLATLEGLQDTLISEIAAI